MCVDQHVALHLPNNNSLLLTYSLVWLGACLCAPVTCVTCMCKAEKGVILHVCMYMYMSICGQWYIVHCTCTCTLCSVFLYVHALVHCDINVHVLCASLCIVTANVYCHMPYPCKICTCIMHSRYFGCNYTCTCTCTNIYIYMCIL